MSEPKNLKPRPHPKPEAQTARQFEVSRRFREAYLQSVAGDLAPERLGLLGLCPVRGSGSGWSGLGVSENEVGKVRCTDVMAVVE